MTRLIAGELGGRTLAVPKSGTRPTTDRVREAVFSRLDHADALRGAAVLDLFAGSGALGLEALSRGATHVTLVEAAPAAAAVISANIRTLGVASRAAVVKEKAAPYLHRASTGWDLVLIDPPYDHPVDALTELLAALVPHLNPGATVVLEGARRAAEPQWPHGIDKLATKDYGETVVHFAHASGSVEP